MKTNYKTIISKLYSFPGDFFIDIREDGKGYTDFYLLNPNYIHVNRVLRAKTKETKGKIDSMVVNLFCEHFVEYLQTISKDSFSVSRFFEEVLPHTSIEEVKSDVKNKFKKGEIIIPVERAILECKLNDLYTVDATDDPLGCESIEFFVTNKNLPDIKFFVNGGVYDDKHQMVDNDIVTHIEYNGPEWIEEYKYAVKEIFGKEI